MLELHEGANKRGSRQPSLLELCCCCASSCASSCAPPSRRGPVVPKARWHREIFGDRPSIPSNLRFRSSSPRYTVGPTTAFQRIGCFRGCIRASARISHFVSFIANGQRLSDPLRGSQDAMNLMGNSHMEKITGKKVEYPTPDPPPPFHAAGVEMQNYTECPHGRVAQVTCIAQASFFLSMFERRPRTFTLLRPRLSTPSYLRRHQCHRKLVGALDTQVGLMWPDFPFICSDCHEVPEICEDQGHEDDQSHPSTSMTPFHFPRLLSLHTLSISRRVPSLGLQLRVFDHLIRAVTLYGCVRVLRLLCATAVHALKHAVRC